MAVERIADLRPGEGRRVILAGAWSFALMTANSSLRPLRETLGIAAGVDSLHWLFTATFLVMLAIVPVHGLVVGRLPRERLVPLVHRFFALNLVAFFAAMQGLLGPSELVQLWTARVFFVWMSVFNLVAISLFWSVMSDLFTGADARRLFGLIALGGSLGAILGPLIGAGFGLWLTPTALPLVAAAALELGLLAARPVLAGREASRTPDSKLEPKLDPKLDPGESAIGGKPLAAFSDLLRSPTLLGVCVYVLLMTNSSTFLYFIQAEIVADTFADDASRVAVFSAMDLAVNALTLTTQGLATGRLIRRFGLGWALAAVPLVCALGFVVLATTPVLAVLVAVQILRRAGGYALAKPAREVLYTSVDRSQRYRAKNLIDTVVYRGGDALTGWAFAGLGSLGLGLTGVALVALPSAATWAAVGAWLGRPRPNESSRARRTRNPTRNPTSEANAADRADDRGGS